MITIFSPKKSNRLKYTLDLVFKQILKVEYQLVDCLDDVSGVSINYSSQAINNVYQIKPSQLLFEDEINESEIPHEFHVTDIVRFFPNKTGDHGFDVFSGIFYLVSRMEEYVDKKRDYFDRFSSASSILNKLDVLDKPLVNIWSLNLLKILNQYYDNKIILDLEYNQINTIDIDNAYAYLHKGFLRTTAATIKSMLTLNSKDFFCRFRVLISKEKDPYDSYDYMLDFQKKNNLKSYYFFLLGDYHVRDKNISFKNSFFRGLIQKINNHCKVGIHPSFYSYLKGDQINKEVKRLQEILNVKIEVSRNHYLRFSVPETYQSLIQSGIKQDFSMGYPDAIGFRAGICTPFHFFDLKSNKATGLFVFPFAYMDGVLKDYLKLDIDEAIKRISVLRNHVKEVNGLFIGVWHNESLSNQGRWKGWREVYESSFELNINS